MNKKAILFDDILPELKQRALYFSLVVVQEQLQQKAFHIRAGILRHYLKEAIDKGIIHDAGRGWYSRIPTKCELDPEPVEGVVRHLETEFPLVEFTCWSTQQLNPWMHHVLAKFITFVNVEREVAPAVADALRDAAYLVHENPDHSRAREVQAGSDTVVVRPLVTVAPRDGHYAPPEAVFVDLFKEIGRLNIMSQAEYQDMFYNLASSYRIAWGSMERAISSVLPILNWLKSAS